MSDWPIPWAPVAGTRTGVFAWLESVLAEGTLGGLSRLPAGAQDALVGAMARIARRVDARHSEAARRFIAQALPHLDEGEREALVLQSWRHFITTLLRNVAFDRKVPAATRLDHYVTDFSPAVQDIVDREAACIAVTAHVGDYDAGAAFFPAAGFRRFYAVTRPPKNKPLSVSTQRLREGRGYRILHRRGAFGDIAKIVGAGGSVALLLDQRPHGNALIAPFFGRMAPCERGAAVLLRRLRVPVIIGACYTTDVPYRYRMFFHTVLQPDDLKGASPEEIVTRVNAEMERLILRHPEQYFWLHDRFRDAPES